METYIRFMAPVVPQTATALLKTIDAKVRNGARRIHLLLSSPGGSVFHGLSIYNWLRGIPVETYTYNFGSVDSIGVVLFCAGSKRFCVPHARFLIHGVSINFMGNQQLDEKSLEEHIKGLRIDYQNIARVIADNTGKTPQSIEDAMNARTTLNSTEAQTYGLVHEVKSALLPADADLITIGEDMVLPMPQAVPLSFPPNQQHLSIPLTNGYTHLFDYNYGTYFQNERTDGKAMY